MKKETNITCSGMRCMTKKWIGVLLSLCMVISMAVPVAAASAVKLSSLTPIESADTVNSGNYTAGDTITTPHGKAYRDVLYFDASLNAYSVYDLGKKYGTLTGKIVTSSQSNTGGSYGITFYGDGKVLKRYTGITTADKDKSFSISVNGIKTLRIETENTGEWSCGWLYLVDSRLSTNMLTLSDSRLEMNAGESTYVTWTYTNISGKNSQPKAKWKSSNTKVAKVSSKGKVVAVGTGTCKLTCTSKGLSKTMNVIVRPNKVTGLKTLSRTKNSVQLQWKLQNNVSGYEVWMYDTDLEEYAKVSAVKGTVNSARINNLKKNTSYKFQVRGYYKTRSGKYYGSFSSTLKAKTSK